MTVLQRYAGEPLRPSPHIVVLGSCKLGNFVVSTPVLTGLRRRFPDSCIGFVGSSVTQDFESAHTAIDWRVSWDDVSSNAGLQLLRCLEERQTLHGRVSLAINLDGFNPITCAIASWLRPVYVAGGSYSQNMRTLLPWGDMPQQRFLADSDWDSPEFLERYKDFFTSNYIAELFCQLAFVADYVDPCDIELPSVIPDHFVPDILIHCTTARSAKIWPFDYWKLVVDYAFEMGLSVGLVGSPPQAQRDSYNAGEGEEWLLNQTQLIDLRGQTTLIQLAGACLQAKAVISVDAGPLHVAAAVGTATYALVGNDINGVGASPVRLWLPRGDNVSRSVALETCHECSSRRFRNDDCVVASHPCMYSVNPQQVIDWISAQFNL